MERPSRPRAGLLGLLLALAPLGAEAGDAAADARAQWQGLVEWMQRGITGHLNATQLAGVPDVNEVLAAQIGADGGRTVVAARDIHDGELLLRLPPEMLMHVGYYKTESGEPFHLGQQSPQGSVSSKLSPLLKASLSGGADLFTFIAPQTWLALYLMEHRQQGSRSAWSPYMSILPETFSTVPVFYSEEDWQWAKGSTFRKRAERHRESLAKQYESLSELIQGFRENYTLEEYLWARSAISSRAFGWALPGMPREEDDSSFMVPLGDMFNHRSPKQIEWVFNDSMATLDYWARENVSKGQELLISYGGKCNSNYLLHYGFAVDGVHQRYPPMSTVRVEMEVDEAVPDRDNRVVWLSKSKLLDKGEVLPPEEFEFKAKWSPGSAESMLGYARLLSIATEAEFKLKTRSSGSCRPFSTPPKCENSLGLENERAALQRCLQAFQKALARYPTSLEEDGALLPSLQGVPRDLVLLRRDEKVVLRWWVRYWTTALECVDLTPDEIVERADKEFGEYSLESRYLKVTLASLISVEGRLRKPQEL